MERDKFIFFVLIFFLLIAYFIRSYIIIELAVMNFEYSQLMQTRDALNSENVLLKSQILDITSFKSIKKEAKDFNYVQPLFLR